MLRFVFFLISLLVLSYMSYAQTPTCGEYNYLFPGESISITNPSFPNSETTVQNCRWDTESLEALTIRCETEFPLNANCATQSLTIEYQDNIYIVCSTGTFVRTTAPNVNVTVLYKNPATASGSSFNCEIKNYVC